VSEPAKKYEERIISLEGMEEFLTGQSMPVAGQGMPEVRPAHATEIGQPKPAQSSTTDLCTIEVAAKYLGVSARTILRRLQKGTLPGCKVPGQFGLEWRVQLNQQEVRPAQDISMVVASTGQATWADQDNLRQTKPDDAEILVKELRSRVSELEDKLEGATYRNGYLEAQLEGRDKEIKLLTDSQHKPAGWRKFWSWFTGR